MIDCYFEEYQTQIPVPHQLVCPISRQIMKNPVIANDGFTYQRSAIQAWLLNHFTSPLTRNCITQELKDNQFLSKIASYYLKIIPKYVKAQQTKQKLLNQNSENMLMSKQLLKSEQQIQSISQKNVSIFQIQNLIQLKFQKKNQKLIKNLQGIYIGQIQQNQRSGYGFQFYQNGDFYEGYWNKNKKYGYGDMLYRSGEVYSGQWKNDLKQSENPVHWIKEDLIYEGNVAQSQFRGKGFAHFSNGKKVYGQFIDQKNFIGTIEYHGNKEQGNFKNYKLNGLGKIITSEKETYQGNFLNGILQGKAIISKSNGEVKFIGYYKEGKPQGFGFQRFDKDSYYKGQWKNGLKQGQGELRNQSYIYWGQFKNDKRNGFGKSLNRYNGNIYQGYWEDNCYNGRGKIYYKSYPFQNCIFQGQFKNGFFSGKGKCINKDDNVFVGNWFNYARFGEGIQITYKSGKAPKNKEKQFNMQYFESKKNLLFVKYDDIYQMLISIFAREISQELKQVLALKIKFNDLDGKFFKYGFLENQLDQKDSQIQEIIKGTWNNDILQIEIQQQVNKSESKLQKLKKMFRLA